MIILLLTYINVSGQNVKSFKVEVTGKGRPMILIPGLYSKGEVWSETVDHYKNKYECHVITLAGFAGEAPYRDDSILFTVKEDLANYIKVNNLFKPVILGHSAGAFIGLWLGSTYPDLTGPIVCVDGIPFLPAMQLPDATSETSRDMGLNLKKFMSNVDTSMIRANQKMYLPTMISDTNRIKTVIEWAIASDPRTAGQVMFEMYTTDLRKEIAGIKSPVLELGTWVAYKAYGATNESAINLLKDQVKELPTAVTRVSDTSRHFIMYDDPEWMLTQIDEFLKDR